MPVSFGQRALNALKTAMRAQIGVTAPDYYQLSQPISWAESVVHWSNRRQQQSQTRQTVQAV